MFQNTLLIIKADYMHKRKPVLIHLTNKGFMILAQRKIQFKPEDAAEFYRHKSEEQNFMLYVIMLSKGVSEAFILTKENAVEELLNTMVCYFMTSVEMERMVHVTKDERNVQSEISFIFPNYIHDPIPVMKNPNFQVNPLLPSLLDKLKEFSENLPTDGNKSWKVHLAEWLMSDNEEQPTVSNQCSDKPTLFSEDKGLQVKLSKEKVGVLEKDSNTVVKAEMKFSEEKPSCSYSSSGSSRLTSSSSCISCNNLFDATQISTDLMKMKDSAGAYFRPKIVPLLKVKEEDEYMAEMCLDLSDKQSEENEPDQNGFDAARENWAAVFESDERGSDGIAIYEQIGEEE